MSEQIQPPPEEVIGEEPAIVQNIAPVPVSVEGSAVVYDRPPDSWSAHTYTVTGANPVKVCEANARRTRILIMNVGIKVCLSPSEAEARSQIGIFAAGNGALSFEMHHRGEMWALAPTGSTDLGIYEEFFA